MRIGCCRSTILWMILNHQLLTGEISYKIIIIREFIVHAYITKLYSDGLVTLNSLVAIIPWTIFFFHRSTAEISKTTQSMLTHDVSNDAVWSKEVPFWRSEWWQFIFWGSAAPNTIHASIRVRILMIVSVLELPFSRPWLKLKLNSFLH